MYLIRYFNIIGLTLSFKSTSYAFKNQKVIFNKSPFVQTKSKATFAQNYLKQTFCLSVLVNNFGSFYTNNFFSDKKSNFLESFILLKNISSLKVLYKFENTFFIPNKNNSIFS
jgi:hypothetical protein